MADAAEKKPEFDMAAAMAQLEAERAEIAALKAKLETQTLIRTEVSEAFRLQQEEAKRVAFGKPTPSTAPVMPPKPEGITMHAIRLSRHYMPLGYYEIVGWHKEAVFKKNAAGQMVEVEKAEFIKGEKKPPNVAGVGSPGKIWADTVIRLPELEARSLAKQGIGALDFD